MKKQPLIMTDPGKAIVALLITYVLIAFPSSAGWFLACITLYYAAGRLQAAFRRLEAQEAEATEKAQWIDSEPLEITEGVVISHVTTAK